MTQAAPETTAVAEPPHNPEAEENVLGAMMLSATAIDRTTETGLEPDDFYRPSHGLIYSAAIALHRLGEPVDPITVAERLDELGRLTEIGGKDRIRQIATLAVTSTNAPHYAKIIVRDARRRRQIEAGKLLIQRAQESADPDEIHTAALALLESSAGRTTARHLQIVTADRFLADTEEIADAAIGEPGETLLPIGGLLIMGGEGGASKTTLTLDAVAHMASGTAWLGYPVTRPLRILIVENEGPRPQFRAKLQAKADSWAGKPWLENVHVWAEPWAAFSFARDHDRRYLTDTAHDLEIDVVVADPLDSLGITGAGTPEDVRGFIQWLRSCGLHNPVSPLAFWLLHHFNKSGARSVVQSLSGAWGGHPDAIIGVELGDSQTTKLTWGKLRHATPPKDKTTILGWDLDTRGFAMLDKTVGATDEQLTERILDHLGRATEPKSQNALEKEVEGSGPRIRIVAAHLATNAGGNLLKIVAGRVKSGIYYVLQASSPHEETTLFDNPAQTLGGTSSPSEETTLNEGDDVGARLPGETNLVPSSPPFKGGRGEDDVVTNGHDPEIDDDEVERLRSLLDTKEPALTTSDPDDLWSS